MENFTRVGKSGKKDDIKVKKAIEFHRTINNSLRAEICDIGGYPYVGLTRFWLPDGKTEFVPTRKSIFLRREQWESLMMFSECISKGFATFANAGIFYLLYLYLLFQFNLS